MDGIAGRLSATFERAVLPTLMDYTRIECLSPSFDIDWEQRGEIDRAASLLGEWCARREVAGAAIEIVRIPGRTPVLFAEVPGDPARATTLIYGHLDKQPPLGDWRPGLSAFEPVREGDRLYGRGTADDGYATFAAFAALEALQEEGVERGPVLVLIEASEESGSPDLESYLDLLAPRIGAPGLVICLDSGCATYDRLWVTTSLRGVLVGTLKVSVLREGVHSGHAGGIVPSSFRIARSLLSRLENEHDGSILPAALRAAIPSHRLAQLREVAELFGEEAVGSFPAVAGLALAGTDAAARLAAGTWEPCLEITGAAGLPDLVAGGNVLRPTTTLKLSIRLPPNVDALAAATAVRELLLDAPPAGATVEVAFEQPGQGWDAPESATWLQNALRSASLEHFGEPPASLGLGGSIPFMAALGTRFADCQFLATGVLGPESNAHGPNEFLHVPTALRVGAVVAEVLAAAP